MLEGARCPVEGPLKVKRQAAVAFTREVRQVLFWAQSPTGRALSLNSPMKH